MKGDKKTKKETREHTSAAMSLSRATWVTTSGMNSPNLRKYANESRQSDGRSGEVLLSSVVPMAEENRKERKECDRTEQKGREEKEEAQKGKRESIPALP